MLRHLFLMVLCSIAFVARADVAMVKGWNLLGNGTTKSIDVAATYGDSSKYITVWKWNTASSKWAFYAPSMTSSALATYANTKGYDVLTTINSKEGYWVNASATTTVSDATTDAAFLNIGDFKVGWNLLAGFDFAFDKKTPSQFYANYSSLLTNNQKSLVTMWSWDSATSNWNFYAPSLDAQGGTILADYIKSKNYLPFSKTIGISDGFWMNVAGFTVSSGSTGSTGSTVGKPTAISQQQKYAISGYIELDASESTDPQNKPLTFNWKTISAPVGWNGFGYNDGNGKVGFTNNSSTGLVFGIFKFELTVNNGSVSSDPLLIQVEVCCDSKSSVPDVSSFISKLPSYTIQSIKQSYEKSKPKTTEDLFRFAAIYGISLPQLEYLASLKPGSLIEKVYTGVGFETTVNAPAPNGGATIVSYGMTFDDVIQVNKNLANIVYPDDFAAAKSKTTELSDPFCDLDPAFNTFRAIDLGDYNLPTIKTVPLKQDITRMAFIKDIWSITNPNMGQGCIKDMDSAYEKTFDRLSQLKINSIGITPWTWFYSNNGVWTIPVSGTRSDGAVMTDDHLTWIVQKAKSRGLKVYWVNQIQGVTLIDSNGISKMLQPGDTKAEDIRNAYGALNTYIKERASKLQAIGVDGMILGSWYWVNFASYLDATEFSNLTVSMISNIKSNFSGKIIYGVGNESEISTKLSDVVDYYSYSPSAKFDSSTIASFSINSIKNQNAIAYAKFKAAAGTKPVIWDLGIQSRKGYFTNFPGYYDPFCTPSGTSNCIQVSLTGDYSMQAVYTEAAFESIGDIGGGELGGVIMPYFIDGNLLPPMNFFNTDATVRGKPAEYIFYKWFNQ